MHDKSVFSHGGLTHSVIHTSQKDAWESAIASVTPGGFATSDDLAKEFGATPSEAAQFHTRVEYLAGGAPKLLSGSSGAAQGEGEGK